MTTYKVMAYYYDTEYNESVRFISAYNISDLSEACEIATTLNLESVQYGITYHVEEE